MFGHSKHDHRHGGHRHEGQGHCGEKMRRGGRHNVMAEDAESARGGKHGAGVAVKCIACSNMGIYAWYCWRY